MRLSKCKNIADLRSKAKGRLPSPMFHYIDGGADDEVSLRRNTEAFDDLSLAPQCLQDVSNVDLSTTLLGKKIDVPFFLSPTGMSRLFHHDAETAVAKAAANMGTFYGVSTMATTDLETIAKATNGPKVFQLYIFKDRSLTTEFIERSKAANYDALCLTIDTAMAGNRERDLVTGMTIPPTFSVNSLLSFVRSPAWVMNYALNPEFKLANVVHRVDTPKGGAMGLIDYVNQQFDRSVTWKDAAWLAAQWEKPLIIKGIQSVQDAKMAREIGASAIMVSNHGGRQLDGVSAPIECIQAIRDAVGDDLEIILDGGVRRGTHILKGIAAGANACSFGRPYLYGLAAGGQQGVDKALDILKTEVERGMVLLGCNSISGLTEEYLGK